MSAFLGDVLLNRGDAVGSSPFPDAAINYIFSVCLL